MNGINPINLVGNWVDGYAIDYHVLYSVYLGEDQFGHPQFDTKRTNIGELLYELKYHNNPSKVEEIVKLIAPFLDEWSIKDRIDFIIPAPASTERKIQPVYEISKKIGVYVNKRVLFNVIEKNSTIQSKNLAHQKNEIEGSIVRNGKFRRKVNLLILDDLFESGRTLGEIYNVLNSDPNVGNIYVLTVTKTRR